jgi:hypothetical protein
MEPDEEKIPDLYCKHPNPLVSDWSRSLWTCSLFAKQARRREEALLRRLEELERRDRGE